MKTTYVALFSIFLLSSSSLHAAGDDYEFNYGPEGRRITLKNNHKLMAVKPTASEKGKSLDSLLGEDSSKFNKVSKLGGFDILSYTGENADETLNRLRRLNTISQGTHVYYTQDDTSVPFVPTGTVYLKFKDDADSELCSQVLENKQLQILEVRGEREFITKITPGSRNPIRVAQEIQNEYAGLVNTAEPELATLIAPKAFTLPTDSLFLSQWHLRNTGNHRGTSVGLKAGADARVAAAWEILQGYGSPNITVAVIDDGFDLAHPDLSGPNKIISPWDFTRGNNNPSPAKNPEGDWHGTACSGVAVGSLGRGSIVGAAPLSKLMPIRWGVDLSDTQVENWFNYATQNGADIISCSWGALAPYFPLSTRQYNAIKNSATNGRNGKGCVVVFAAGNDNRNINEVAYDDSIDIDHNPFDHVPQTLDGFAVHPNVISVAASTSRDQKSYYSNFGKEISICAPSSGAGGMGILTADVMGNFSYGGRTYSAGYASGDYTYDFGGTSSSCPLVAGISALVLSANQNLTSVEVKNILQRTARKIGPNDSYQNGHSIYYGYGCINAAEAVTAAKQQAGVPLPANIIIADHS